MITIKGKLTCSMLNGTQQEFKGKATIPEDSPFSSVIAKGKIEFGTIKSAKYIALLGKSAGEKIEASDVEIKGKTELKEINAQNVNIVFSGDNEYGSIRAEKVTISPMQNDPEAMKSAFRVLGSVFGIKITELPDVSLKVPSNHIGFILAQDVEINSCDVETIECRNAIIKGKSTIGVLKYSGTITVDSEASVFSQKI